MITIKKKQHDVKRNPCFSNKLQTTNITRTMQYNLNANIF